MIAYELLLGEPGLVSLQALRTITAYAAGGTQKQCRSAAGMPVNNVFTIPVFFFTV
jgi:hypothetical protein